MNRDLRDLLAQAEREGATVERRRGGHYRVSCPSGVVFSGATPSDIRGIRNLRAQLRRYGLRLRKEDGNVAAKPKTSERKTRKWCNYHTLAEVAGYTIERMAEDLEVSPNTIRRYLAGHPCGVRESVLDAATDRLVAFERERNRDPIEAPEAKPAAATHEASGSAVVETRDGLVEVLGTTRVDVSEVLRSLPNKALFAEIQRRMGAV